MRARPLALAALLILPPSPAMPGSESAQARACVVLLHGLARTSRSMGKTAQALAREGFFAVNLDYPSSTLPIEDLAVETVPEGVRQCAAASASPIHFVTHSMGGLLIRYYLDNHALPALGRVVMLSPPNQGSEAADALRGNPLYRWFNGPAGQQLGTGRDGIARRLGPVAYPVGVITGNRHAPFDAWLAEIIPGEDDGKVAVERAKVSGMSDFLVLPYSHPFIMRKDRVIEQTITFLRQGRFDAHGLCVREDCRDGD